MMDSPPENKTTALFLAGAGWRGPSEGQRREMATIR
jgi:hypothetical protein